MEKIKYFTKDETTRFFRAIKQSKNPRNLCLFSLMLHFGLRVEEAIQIRLDDLLDKQTRLYVRRVKGGENFCFDLKKSDVKLIKDWLEERQHYPEKDSPYFFLTKRGTKGKMTRQGIRFIMQEYCSQARIPKDKQHPHILRHTSAVNILMSSSDVFVVKTILGHKKINSSMRYLELGTDEKRKMLKGVLDKAFPD